MAERKKSSHNETFSLDELMDIQIQTWGTTNSANWTLSTPMPKLFRAGAPGTPPAPLPDRPAPLRPELRELLEREAAPEPDELRIAFRIFLENARWQCDQCGRELDSKTLKVPPPTILANGDPFFVMYCASCAD